PLRDRLRQHLHVIGGGDKRTVRAGSGEGLGHEWHLGLLAGMEHVPALTVVRIAIQVLVAGDAPDVRRDAVLLFQHLLRLEQLIHYGPAAEQLNALLRVLLAGLLEAVYTFENAVANLVALWHFRHG